jgi:DNA-cytosine methyltransferase
MIYYDLFSGIGGFSKAIHDNFEDATCLGFSEIIKPRVQLFLDKFPGSTYLGDIRSVKKEQLVKNIDLLTFGSPCKDLSIQKGKNRQGLKGEQSSLFFEALRIMDITKPKFFIMENVYSMAKSERNEITEHLGVEPIIINSGLVSAQNRERLYWTNIPNVAQPEDQGLLLKRNGVLVHSWSKSFRPEGYKLKCPQKHFDERIRCNGKAHTLVANPDGSESINFFPDEKIDLLLVEDMKRQTFERKDLFCNKIKPEWKLTPEECEELQTFPKGWTEGFPDNVRKAMLGDAVTVNVIKHILGFIP